MTTIAKTDPGCVNPVQTSQKPDASPNPERSTDIPVILDPNLDIPPDAQGGLHDIGCKLRDLGTLGTRGNPVPYVNEVQIEVNGEQAVVSLEKLHRQEYDLSKASIVVEQDKLFYRISSLEIVGPNGGTSYRTLVSFIVGDGGTNQYLNFVTANPLDISYDEHAKELTIKLPDGRNIEEFLLEQARDAERR